MFSVNFGRHGHRWSRRGISLKPCQDLVLTQARNQKALTFPGSTLATGIVSDFPDVPLEGPSFGGFGGSIFAGTGFGDPGAILV